MLTILPIVTVTSLLLLTWTLFTSDNHLRVEHVAKDFSFSPNFSQGRVDIA